MISNGNNIPLRKPNTEPSHGYTTHGFACCSEAQGPVPMARARCMGPGGCKFCKREVTLLHYGVLDLFNERPRE